MEERLAQILRDQMKIRVDRLALTRLHGDASYRTYYRLSLASGRSFIVMQLPEGKSSVSEEITNLKEKPAELPFINIDRFLKGRGLPVPEVYHYDEKAGLLILEDFGDEPLEKRLDRSDPNEREKWYRKAIDLLIRFQKGGMDKAGGCLAHRRSFDETLFNWEFEHFIEYGIEVRTGIKVQPQEMAKIRRETGQIASALQQLPQTLTHRDFQSRNLMIQGGELKLLDFQDALLGPELYDLVALLRDSYVSLPWNLVEKLIRYFQESKKQPDTTSPYKTFDWITIQRKLKDAGRFVYIDRVKGNPAFLKFIPTSLAYVREAFERQPDLKELFVVLKKYVPEFN